MTRNSLKKHERLKSQSLLDCLFKEGKSQFVYPLKLLYQIRKKENLEDWPLLFSVSVPKRKIKSAVKRNLIKRRVREAYRLNKNELQLLIQNKRDVQVSLMFIYIEANPKPYGDIEKSVKRLNNYLLSELAK